MAQSVSSVDRPVINLDIAVYLSVNVVIRLLSCSSPKEHSYASLEFLGKSKNIASRSIFNKV